MFFHDTYSDNFSLVDEALRRMPDHLVDARNERLIRATMLGLKNEWLPKEQWSKYEDVKKISNYLLHTTVDYLSK